MTEKRITAEVEAQVWVSLEEWSDDEIKDEFHRRNGTEATPSDLLYYWIRDQNPPQFVKDWIWEVFGRIV